MAKAKNLFISAKENLDSIAQILESSYSDKKRFHRSFNILKRPQNILKKKLIIKLTNGKKSEFQSFRIQHSDTLGPFMGGTRFSSNLEEDDLKALSILESIKSAVSCLPFGGAFGGITVEKQKITEKDLERVSKAYSQFLVNHIGVWKDVLSTEVSTTDKTMNWMVDAYEKKKKFHSPAVFNSNVYCLDGAPYILTEYLKSSNIISRFRKIDIAIHGFGNRTITFLKNINYQNFRIVAISDKSGGVVNSNGFNFEEIKNLKDKFSSLKEVSIMQKIEFIENEKLIELPVDILVISSKDNVVDKEVASKIKAKLILELSSFGINNEALDTLNQNKIEVLPSILLNSGFSILTHLEWVQKMHGYKWTREEVAKRLHSGIVKIFLEVKNISSVNCLTIERSTYYLGLKRLVDSLMSRGRV